MKLFTMQKRQRPMPLGSVPNSIGLGSVSVNASFTLTDPIPILLPILIWVPWECTVILSKSDTISECESGSVSAPLGCVETELSSIVNGSQKRSKCIGPLKMRLAIAYITKKCADHTLLLAQLPCGRTLSGILYPMLTLIQEHIPSEIVAHKSGYLALLQIGNRGSFVSPMILRTSSTVFGFPSDVNSFTRSSLAWEFLEMKSSFVPTSRRRYLNKMFQFKLTNPQNTPNCRRLFPSLSIWPLDQTSIWFPVEMGK